MNFDLTEEQNEIAELAARILDDHIDIEVLRKTEENYSLFVKKMPFDVLLSTIPWNISMVQNAFMKYRIIVDWN